MLSKVRPCHSVNVLTFPGCDRSVRGNGTSFYIYARAHVYIGEKENMRECIRPVHLAPSPVLDVCEDCATELQEDGHTYTDRPVYVQQRAS